MMIMPPGISLVTKPQVGLNCDDVADWLHANNPEMYFFVSFCNFGDAAACGGFGNGGGGGGGDILDDHEENDVELIPTRDVKCIADAPDFIAPEVNFTFGASNLNNLNFKDLPVFQRYMLQNAIVIMKVTKRNCKNFGRGKKAHMQNIFPNLSKFAFEFKNVDGHDYFHIFTTRDTDHSCWNWVSKPEWV